VEKEIKLGGGVIMKLVLIPAGEFVMGSPASAPGRGKDEGPQHRVRITKPFYMGACEVTIEEYRACVRNGGDGSGVNWHDNDCPLRQGGNYALSGHKFAQSDRQPMVEVRWDGAVKFCEWLSRKTSRTVRLPTEAEWEYACRAGSTTAYCFGDSDKQLGDYAWYSGNCGGKTHPVGGKKPNAWGLYDMHGNVVEWCQSLYKDYPYSEGDGRERLTGTGSRVLRGGSWGFGPAGLRAAYRRDFHPSITYANHGFRVVVSPR